MTTADEKAQWRARLRAARRARLRTEASCAHDLGPPTSSAAGREAVAQAVARAAEPLLEPRAGLVVAAYRALPTEPPTHALMQQALRAGLRVLVPELLPNRDLDWRDARAGGPDGPLLGPDAIGAAGVVLLPALAVDRAGRRLGQGGGSYDRALARRSVSARLVAIVWDGELVDGPIPTDPHDVPVDAVITPGEGLVPLR